MTLDERAMFWVDVVCRIMYQTPCEESTNEPEYGPYSGLFIGYPETDAHLRKRIEEIISDKKI